MELNCAAVVQILQQGTCPGLQGFGKVFHIPEWVVWGIVIRRRSIKSSNRDRVHEESGGADLKFKCHGQASYRSLEKPELESECPSVENLPQKSPCRGNVKPGHWTGKQTRSSATVGGVWPWFGNGRGQGRMSPFTLQFWGSLPGNDCGFFLPFTIVETLRDSQCWEGKWRQEMDLTSQVAKFIEPEDAIQKIGLIKSRLCILD